ncbi:MAG TPA: TIR domain-containing protein [Allosphingosinicella sp.]|nr:TIR domain-containing protein [Allosphingosinicella sp.]
MRGFISYSHDDHKECGELRKHLRPLERALGIDFYTDHRNQTGQHFDANIKERIEQACIHVVLVSSNSLWSDFIMDTELPLIRQKQQSDDDLVLYVIVDDCAWELLAGTLLVSPRGEDLRVRPIKSWRNRNSAYNAARAQIQAAIEGHFGIKAKPLADGGAL